MRARAEAPPHGPGFHDATTYLAQIEQWWARWPEANLGLPTGAVSGVVVVDVDVREDVDGRESMRRALDAGWVGMPVFTVVSPSGGRHGYYPATPGVVQRSWQAARAGVDFRGDGGYIVVPPSHTAVGLTLVMLTPEMAGRGGLREGCRYGKAEKVYAGVSSGGCGSGAGY